MVIPVGELTRNAGLRRRSGPDEADLPPEPEHVGEQNPKKEEHRDGAVEQAHEVRVSLLIAPGEAVVRHGGGDDQEQEVRGRRGIAFHGLRLLRRAVRGIYYTSESARRGPVSGAEAKAMPFDEQIDPDIQSVLNAAAMLDVTEFELFRLAYLRWYGQVPVDEKVEPHFVAYMFRNVVPLWVRHFARKVERLFHRGELDRRALGVDRLSATPEMVSLGIRYSVAIGTLLIALTVFAEFVATVLDLGERCLFPPCY